MNLDEGVIYVKDTMARVKDYGGNPNNKTTIVIGDPKTKSVFRAASSS